MAAWVLLARHTSLHPPLSIYKFFSSMNRGLGGGGEPIFLIGFSVTV